MIVLMTIPTSSGLHESSKEARCAKSAATSSIKPKAYSYIRFSTPQQLTGDSLRRQLEHSEAWAIQQGLELDDTLRDLGVSAFKGKNKSEGALGRFIAEVKSGKVASGSTLIVESLDRLSREDVMTAFLQFSEILQHGISIVTLTDKQTYSKESVSTNPMHLFGSLMVMQRANEESQTKSFRLRESWKNRRKNAALKAAPMTPICPAWLKLKADKSGFELRADRAKLIKEIFELRKSGKGKLQIQRILNERKVVPWNLAKRKANRGNPRFWHFGYIGRILENRQVIGEFQAYRVVNGKRVPSGDPIPHYFPQAIEPELFYAVNGARKLVPGRPSKLEKNLFSGVAFCHCGAPIHHTDKGEYKYLVCSAAKAKAGCKYVSWTYHAFEISFLTWVQRPDVVGAISETNALKLATLETETEAANGKLLEIQSKLDALGSFAESGKAPATILDRMNGLEAEKVAVTKLRDEHALKLDKERESVRTSERDAEQLQDLAESVKDVSVRASLKHEIRKRVARIVIYPERAPQDSELRAKLVEQIQMLNDIGASGPVASSAGDLGRWPRTRLNVVNNPLYRVFFQNGKELTVIPDPKNPMGFLFCTPVLNVQAVAASREDEALWDQATG